MFCGDITPLIDNSVIESSDCLFAWNTFQDRGRVALEPENETICLFWFGRSFLGSRRRWGLFRREGVLGPQGGGLGIGFCAGEVRLFMRESIFL